MTCRCRPAGMEHSTAARSARRRGEGACRSERGPAMAPTFLLFDSAEDVAQHLLRPTADEPGLRARPPPSLTIGDLARGFVRDKLVVMPLRLRRKNAPHLRIFGWVYAESELSRCQAPLGVRGWFWHY